MARSDRNATVYSSEHGRVCPHCGLPAKRCACRANPRGRVENPEGDGIARVGCTRRGRGGKTVTTVTGLQLRGDELVALARDLKRHCGAGGSVKNGVIELQGDRRDAVLAELEGRGIPARRTGG
jgi:translation initiation factor 1